MPWMVPAAMIGSAVIGGAASMNASSQASKAAGAGLSLQAALANQQMALAGRQLNAQLGKQVDAMGNQQVYDEATNTWHTILSPIGRQLQEATNKEQLLRLTHDANLRREGMDKNAARRGDEGRLADALMRQYQYTQSNPRDMGDEMTSQLRLANMQGMADANEELRRNFSLQSLRTGTDARTASDALRDMGKNWGDQVRSANASVPVEGMQLGQAMAAGRMGDTLNQYNMLASRASNFEDAPFTPSNLNDSLAAVMANQRLNAARGGSVASGAYGAAASGLANGMAPFMKRDDTMTNLAFGAGDMLTKILGNKDFMDWMSSDSKNGGYSAAEASRIRNDTNAMWGDRV